MRPHLGERVCIDSSDEFELHPLLQVSVPEGEEDSWLLLFLLELGYFWEVVSVGGGIVGGCGGVVGGLWGGCGGVVGGLWGLWGGRLWKDCGKRGLWKGRGLWGGCERRLWKGFVEGEVRL